MVRTFILMLASAVLVFTPASDSHIPLHAERSSQGDLEVGGMLAGAPNGATRYLRYEDLLEMPQQTYTVNDDQNLPPNTQVSGVPLAVLAESLNGMASDRLIVAICDDRYRSNYSHEYVAAHQPLLVLRINGKPQDQWPALREIGDPRPYMITHPFFKPAFKVLSHDDEAQIPYGVVRLEFRRESVVFGAIQPPGKWAANSPVELGYAIARQDCFRCHNMGTEGGTKAGRTWLQLAERAKHDPQRFRMTIRDPKSVDPKAAMPAHAGYDRATLNALTAYFRTFSRTGEKP